MSGVDVHEQRGAAAELHGLDPFVAGAPARAAVWYCRFDAAAIVLGSRQTPDVLDADACAAAGLAIAARRSGGGAVLLRPGAVVWIDLVAPSGVAPDDVRGSMLWAGEIWRDALIALGVAAERLTVHRDGMVCTPWSNLVCFAGLGPGEVLVDDRKLVGLSQRRTRHGIRVQGQVHRRAIVGETAGLFRVPTPEVPLAEPAVLSDAMLDGIDDPTLAAAVARAVTVRMTRT